MSRDGRVFSEQEVGEIVQRAAELQERSPERGLSYTPGVTREQLERVAAEVGVEPEFLEQAIRERLEPPRGRWHLLREEERVVTGELDPRDFDVLLAEVSAGHRRHATQIGRTLRTQVWTGSGFARLEVTSRNDRTRIRLRPFPVLQFLGTFYPTFFASTAGGAALSHAGHGLAAALMAAGAVVAGGLGFGTWLRHSNRAMHRLGDKLQRRVAEQVAQQRGEAEGGVRREARAAASAKTTT
jgi:hypothetical protein